MKTKSTQIGNELRLIKNLFPNTEEAREYMAKVPYALAMGSLLYEMVCTIIDIDHAVGVVNRFMSNLG